MGRDFVSVLILPFCIFLFPLLIDVTCEDEKSDTLVLLHVIFRHGDRTNDLENVYPKDPYGGENYYPYGYGQLTNTGKRREYEIGTALRKTYCKFIGKIYTPEILDARSTNFNRTKMSLELVLAGLFPPTDEQRWLKSLNWQPIPYNYLPTKQDHVLESPRGNCPNYIKHYRNYLSSPDGQQIYEKYKKLYAYTSANTGNNISIPLDLYGLYFCLSTEEEWGFELPPWTKPVWPKNITEVAIQEYYVGTATPIMRKLSGGLLLRNILNDTEAKIQGTLNPKDRKLYLYSGHESTVALLLIILDVFYPHVPPYGSYVVLEVHRINKVYGIKILYQDYTEDNPKVLKTPGCEDFCPLNKFKKLMEKNLPTNEDVCGNEGQC